MALVIEAQGIERVYGRGQKKHQAVKGVDLTLAAGELLAVLGVNGAGKTSLMEVLSGMAPASGGTVSVFGSDPIRKRRAVRARTGIMLQEAGFAGELTPREMLRMWAVTLPAPRPVGDVLADVRLQDRADLRISSLSGGERRRLDLALATIGNPDLLFLDEPTTGLDPASRAATWEMVSNLLREGTSVILTTHYLEEAEAHADRVMIMADGRIVREGSVTDLTREHNAQIRYIHEPRLTAARLERLPAVKRTFLDRSETVLDTTDVQATLTALLALASEMGVELAGLEARAATLEASFLALEQADLD